MEVDDYFFAVGRGGLDDYFWIVWRGGNKVYYFCPSRDNFAHERECPAITESTEEVLAAAMASEFKKRAPFKLTRRQLPPGAYYPRIRRGELIDNQVKYGLSSLSVDEMNLRQALTSSASVAGILFKKMQAVFEVVEPVHSQAAVYGMN